LGELDAGEDYFWSGRRDRGGGFDYLRDGSRGRQAHIIITTRNKAAKHNCGGKNGCPSNSEEKRPTRSRRTCPGRTCPGLAGSTDRCEPIRAFAGRLATEA